jgi:negative regulator of replication initiation
LATIANLYVDSGSDYSNIITIASSTGSALDLTNYTVKSQMRKSYGSSTAYDFTTSVYDAATGKIRLQMTATNTSLIPSGRYLYDIEITNTNTGAKTRVLEGIVMVTPEITKI